MVNMCDVGYLYGHCVGQVILYFRGVGGRVRY